MSLLSEQERKQLEDDLEQQIGNHAFDAIERVILAKLAGAELPEPAMRTHGAIDTTEKLWFTADQLHQAYAQGAAAQLAEKPRLYAYTVNKVHNEFCEFEPPDDAYDEGTLTPLYTRKEPK